MNLPKDLHDSEGFIRIMSVMVPSAGGMIAGASGGGTAGGGATSTGGGTTIPLGPLANSYQFCTMITTIRPNPNVTIET